ncbi:MAG: cyclic nucleotide-binding domain-containing protein [Gammaproteobacteria bacterium SHHR-1]
MNLFETIAWTAFLMGLISACSLPMGALLGSFWRPSDRVTAVFMAFGGGALLAALTIDLVGTALAEGHSHALSLGAILGGLIFVLLNRLVNDYGGFLRKASTTIYHLRRKEYERLKQIVRQLTQAELFDDLSNRDYKALAPSVKSQRLSAGETLFHAGDAADALYILIDGRVDLLDQGLGPDLNRPRQQAERFDLLDWRAALLGTPQAQSAIASRDSTLLLIPRRALDGLLLNSEAYRQRVHLLLRSPETAAYLQQAQGLTAQQAEDWLQQASRQLIRNGRLPQAIAPLRNCAAFIGQQGAFGRYDLLQGLPETEMERIGQRLTYHEYSEGQQICHQGELADRLFLLDQGRVSLIEHHASQQLGGRNLFGLLSLISGGRHRASAIALETSRVWELRRQDLAELLSQCPHLLERLRQLLQGPQLQDYLTQSQGLGLQEAEQWTRTGLQALAQRQLPPRLLERGGHNHASQGAPLAIFLGITLDGIPESLVIGASMIHHQVSLSLIVGLFLSNFPEALSSSVGMRQQGVSFIRVMSMWSGLMLLTGVGAAAGSQFFVGAGGGSYALVQGIAAGAMLTMIAETMLPEAYFKGGSVVGMSTLLGFLAAIFAKTLEV